MSRQRLSRPATSGAAPPAWKITLAKLAIDGASIAAEDRSVKPAMQLKIAPLTLTVQNYSSDGAQPLSFDLDAGLGAERALHAGGTLALSPLSAAVTVDLKEFDLPPLQPYVSQHTDLTLYRGRLASQLQLAYAASPQKGQPQLKVGGGIQVTDLALATTPPVPTSSPGRRCRSPGCAISSARMRWRSIRCVRSAPMAA